MNLGAIIAAAFFVSAVTPAFGADGMIVKFKTGSGDLPGSAMAKNGDTGKVKAERIEKQSTKYVCAIRLQSACKIAGIKAELAGDLGDSVKIWGTKHTITVTGPVIDKQEW